jgi:hypothetical protein
MADKWYDKVWDFVSGQSPSTYANLAKTGVAALSTYASWKDQQKKNEMQQAAYDDFMAQAQAAGHEAQAAVDINLTPMEVSGVPTTKADITDFTPVAKGGLMTLPNKQRKRYYAGTDEEEVLDTEEEVLSPFDLQQETGIDLMGEQVKYETGNPREGAWSVWNSGGIDQQLYEFDFEIFFDSGDWSDHLRGQVDVEENMQMASGDPMLQDEYDKYVFEIQEQGGTPMSIEDFRDQAVAGQANGGIIGLRHGGRPGYAEDGFVTADVEEVVSEVSPERKNQIEGNQEIDRAYNQIITKFYETFPGAIKEEEYSLRDMVAMMQAEGVINQDDLEILGFKESMDMITPASVEKSAQRISMGDTQYGNVPEELFAQGGRIGYAQGSGIMDLGGMEKDYRTTGGFVPIGAYEKKDDVPARLSKNEFVMTADAVRAAGGGSINKGAQRMYDTMKHLEASPQSKRMTA